MKANTLQNRIDANLTTKGGAIAKKYANVEKVLLGERYHGAGYSGSGRCISKTNGDHFAVIEGLAAVLFDVQGYADNHKAAAIEKKIKDCKLATQVTRCDSIACVAKFDGAALISNETFEDIRVNIMYAAGMLYIVLVRNVMYGDVVRIVLHPDGSAEYVLDQIPF